MAPERNRTHQQEVSGEQYRLLFESNPLPMWVYDLETLAFLAVNDTAVRKYGFSRRKFLSMTIADIRPAEDVPTLMAHLARTANGLDEAGTWRHRKNDGSIIDVEVTSHTILWEGRRAKLVMAHDITERKRAEEELRLERDKFVKIAATVPGVVCSFRLRPDGSVHMPYASPASQDVTGFQPEELARDVSMMFALIHPDDSRHNNELIAESAQSMTPWHNEFRYRHPQKGEIWIEGHSMPQREEDGSTIWHGFVTDITERKRAEEALHESQARVLSFVSNAPVVLFVLDANGIFTFSEGRGLQALGLRPGEVVGRSALELYQEFPEVVDALKRALSGEFTSAIHDMGRWVFDVYYTPLKNEQGRITGLIGVATDITERKRAEEALQETNEALRSLIEASPVSILTLDPDGNVKSWNPVSERMFGWSEAEVLGRFLPYLPKDKLDEHRVLRERVLRGESFTGVEVRRLRKDGSPIDLSVSTAPLHDAKGNVIGIMGVNVDITERKRAEEALRKSESNYRHLVETMQDGVYRSTHEGKFLDVNPAMVKMLGYDSKEDLMAIDIKSQLYFAPEDRESLELDQKLQEMAVFRLRKKDGSELWVEDHGRFEVDEKGTILYHEGVLRDITQRRTAEEALRRSQEQMELLIENSEDIILLQDIDGKYLHYSGATRYGTTADEVLGKYPSDFHDPHLAARITERIRQVCTSGTSVTEDEETTWQGKRYWFNSQVSPARDAQGRIVGAITVSRNITERKQLEEQLLQAQKLEAVGRLAGGVAHDYNNMIGVILGYAKLIENQLNPLDPLRRHIQAIASAAERSANLTKQLLAFARKQVIAPVPLNLNESLSSLQKMLTRLLGEDLNLTLVAGQDLWNVKIDPTQIDQILANLATNARDAIDDVGTITIATANINIDTSYLKEHPEFTPGEYVILTFSDTGAGMDRATQERIFEPFFTTKPEGQGTGLGLATVFGIVKQNNGFIEVSSDPGKGTTFRIYLPRYHGEAETPIKKEEDIPLKGTETVLVVEDEEQLLELSCAALEMYGYTILSAKSPGEAIILCERTNKKIDLLITDVVMPGMNGKELKERLGTLRSGMKTIFMSGYTADVVAHRGVLDGGVSFLQKPFTPQALARKVREVLNG